MNIDWIIPCRFAEVHDNLGTIIGAGIDTLWAPELPAQLQVGLAIRLLAMDEELKEGIKHTIVNRVRNPAGDVIGDGNAEFEIQAESARPEWLAGVMFPMTIGFEATEAGTYTLEFTVDASTESLPIHVVEGRPDKAA